MFELVGISIINVFAKLLKFAFEVGTSYFTDKETYGSFAVLLSYILIYSKIVSFGLPNIMIRDLPKSSDSNSKSQLIYNSSLIIFLVTVSVYMLISLLRVKYLSEYIEAPIIALSTGLLILYSTYIRSMTHIKQWIFLQDINLYIFYFIGLAITYLFYNKNIDIALIIKIYSYAIFSALISVFLIVKFKYRLLLISSFSIAKIKYLSQHSFPVLFTGLTYLILSRIDVIMLENYVDIKLVGEYNIVARVTMQVLFFNQVIVAYFYPRLARKFANKVSYENIAMYNTKFVFLSMFSVLFVSLVLYILIAFFNLFDLLHIIHKDKLFLVFCIFAIAQIIYSGISFYGHILLYIHKQKIEYFNNILILIIGISLNFHLIPVYGTAGAAMGSVLAIIFGSILEMVQVKYYTGTFFIKLDIGRLLNR